MTYSNPDFETLLSLATIKMFRMPKDLGVTSSVKTDTR